MEDLPNSGLLPESRVPNWFYYYKRAFENLPCIITYVNEDGSYFENASPYDPNAQNIVDHIHLGNNAAGVWSTNIFAKVPKAVGYDLKEVGYERVRGIDTFARIVLHEYTHKLCWEYIHNGGMADVDDDRVPDAWESAVGLDPGIKDSTGFGDTLASFPGSTYNASDGDREVFARMHEKAVFGDENKDWAADTGTNSDKNGLNFVTSYSWNGTPNTPPPSRCKRTFLNYTEGSGAGSDQPDPSWQWPTLPSASVITLN